MQRRGDARRGAVGAAPARARARRRERRFVAARLRRVARTHRVAASVRTASRAAHPSPEHGLRLDMDASMNTLVRPAGSPLNDKVDSAVSWRAAAYLRRVLVFVLRRRVVDRHSLLTRHDAAQLAATPLARTAIVMPQNHESVERSLAGLRAIYVSLQETGALDHFEFFILSDSRDPEVWLEEQAAWYRLCRELNAAGHIHYRRRTVHLRHKSGNVADFLRRWGDDYDYFMVLDADSLASGESLVRMVRIMEREPQAGILQTNPAIMNARSAFARIQQFASRAYGGIFAAVS